MPLWAAFADDQEGRNDWLWQLGPLGWAGVGLAIIASIIVPLRHRAGRLSSLVAATLWGGSLAIMFGLAIVDLGYGKLVWRNLELLLILAGPWLLVMLGAYLYFLSLQRQRRAGPHRRPGAGVKYPPILIFFAVGAAVLYVAGGILGGYDGGGIGSALSWTSGFFGIAAMIVGIITAVRNWR